MKFKINLLEFVPWMVVVISLALLISHVFNLGELKVDNTALTLVGIILISPSLKFLKKVKIGGLEAEISSGEVKKIKDQMSGADSSSMKDVNEIEKQYEDHIMQILEVDPPLALAKIRIEIESKINSLSSINFQMVQGGSLNRMILKLREREVIPESLSRTLQEFVTVLNRSIHGERVDKDVAASIAEIGFRLIYELTNLLKEAVSDVVEKVDITTEESDLLQVKSKYEVVTVVPIVDKPYKNIRILNQEGLNQFLEGYEEFAEFLVSIERVAE